MSGEQPNEPQAPGAAEPARATDSNRQVLREAILKAYDPETLRMTLAEAAHSRDLDTYVSRAASHRDQVFQLIDTADREGWLDELIETLLKGRARNRAFTEAVQPIKDRLKAGHMLDDPAGPASRPPSTTRSIFWIALSIGIIGTSVMTSIFSGALSLASAAPLIVGLLFLILGALGLLARESRISLGLFSLDQRILPGIGLIGLLLIAVLLASAVGTAMAFMASRHKVPVVVSFVGDTLPLSNHNVFAELLASDDTTPERTRGRTTPPNAEALLRLRPNEFYRFGIAMQHRGRLQEGIFPSRVVKDHDQFQFDIRTIAQDAWLDPGGGGTVAVVAEDAQTLSPNLPADVRAAVARGRAANVASPTADQALRDDRSPFGLPVAPWTADRVFFTGGYDPQKRRPVFVAFKLDPRTPPIRREDRDARFEPDPLLPEGVQPNTRDFTGSGYDRGHLITNGDVRPAADAVQEANYLSAVVPQAPRSNRQSWLWVERYTTRAQELTRQPLWVLAGPVYRRTPAGTERVIVIGPGAVPVPTDLFRILLRQRGSEWEVQAFLAPNDQTDFLERDPLRFVTSVAEIEKLTGIVLLPRLPPALRDVVNKTNWAPTPPG